MSRRTSRPPPPSSLPLLGGAALRGVIGFRGGRRLRWQHRVPGSRRFGGAGVDPSGLNPIGSNEFPGIDALTLVVIARQAGVLRQADGSAAVTLPDAEYSI